MSLALVTGGAGFIGTHLANALLAEGFDVRVLDVLEPPGHDGNRPARLDARVELQVGDVRQPADLLRALDGVELVCHLAATGGFTERIAHYVTTNSVGTALLLEAIREHRLPVRRVLVASSVAVYGEGTGACPNHHRVRPRPRRVEQLEAQRWEPLCPSCDAELAPRATAETDAVAPERPYSISKYDQERLVLSLAPEIGFDAAALRYFLTYGPGQSPSNPYTGVISIFANRAANQRPPVVYEDGRQTRDFVYVDDLVDAHLALLRQPSLDGRVFNVGTGEATAIGDVARRVLEALELPYEPELPGSFRLGDVRHVYADSSELRSIGWSPRVELEEGISRFVDWFREAGASGEVFGAAEQQLRVGGLVRGGDRDGHRGERG